MHDSPSAAVTVGASTAASGVPHTARTDHRGQRRWSVSDAGVARVVVETVQLLGSTPAQSCGCRLIRESRRDCASAQGEDTQYRREKVALVSSALVRRVNASSR